MVVECTIRKFAGTLIFTAGGNPSLVSLVSPSHGVDRLDPSLPPARAVDEIAPSPSASPAEEVLKMQLLLDTKSLKAELKLGVSILLVTSMKTLEL